MDTLGKTLGNTFRIHYGYVIMGFLILYEEQKEKLFQVPSQYLQLHISFYPTTTKQENTFLYTSRGSG
jgi:hypothetical protein